MEMRNTGEDKKGGKENIEGKGRKRKLGQKGNNTLKWYIHPEGQSTHREGQYIH